jgi:hypothetical protein
MQQSNISPRLSAEDLKTWRPLILNVEDLKMWRPLILNASVELDFE